MRGELVAFDLETTGLDVETDSIIEIGAVRIVDGVVTDEYSTLVNPGFAIPQETTYITGIEQKDLRNAPTLAAILPDIAHFIGDAPVIAHNANFDVSFLKRFGLLSGNLAIDTIEVASIINPTLPSYSLGSLVEQLDIELENAHRALDDARATAYLYIKMWRAAQKLPKGLVQEIVRYSQPVDWPLRVFFEALLDTAVEAESEPTDSESNLEAFDLPPDSPTMPTTPSSVDVVEVEAILGENGRLAQSLDGYEHRVQQVAMARSVTEAFNNQQQVMIEAGTGIGKSLAYLTPAVLWAIENQSRVVVSTNTITLQDQLIEKDIPLLQSALDVPFNAAVMKGRANYLCPRRLETMRHREPTSVDELRTVIKLLIWLNSKPSGDRGELNLRGNENYIWSRLSAADEDCTSQRCTVTMRGTCPYHQARLRAENAQVLIVNHALLIADSKAEKNTLPAYDNLIIDEAHQLEDAITNGLTVRIDQIKLGQRLGELGGTNRGLLGDVLRYMRSNGAEKESTKLEMFVQDVEMAIRAMQQQITRFFDALAGYITDTGQQNKSQIRLTPANRKQSEFQLVQAKWQQLAEFFDVIADAMKHILGVLGGLNETAQLNDLVSSLAATARYLSDKRHELDAFSTEPDDNWVYWLHYRGDSGYIAIQMAPHNVGPYLNDAIWSKKQTVVMTSATLQTGNGFAYVKDRLHANHVLTESTGSAFDYKKSALIFLPEDIAEPNQPNYQKAIERGIISLAAALQGRVMVLFTSYNQLRETAANIAPRLALGGIVVYDQATGNSQESLLDRFKSSEKAVLLGTRSYWDGVDIPGDDLSALVITRLPFAVPTDPVFAARSDTYSDAFNSFAVPNAVLRFRQGFGRLIRTRDDRGIVAIFDSRIIHKRYGSQFLEALPDCTIERGPLDNLPGAAQKWLDK
ncbi:MAG: 3'-5' exoribonuclease [Anaerolineae bacterium]|nr:3'-5' exoribonuclease [Anaerolineae bacterium]